MGAGEGIIWAVVAAVIFTAFIVGGLVVHQASSTEQRQFCTDQAQARDLGGYDEAYIDLCMKEHGYER